MSNTLSSSAENFRSKTVLQFNRNDAIKIAFHGEGIARTVIKGAEDKWTDDTGREWTDQEINSVLGNMSNLRCTSFLDSVHTGPASVITVTGTREYSLSLYPETGEGYPAESSGHSHPFIISSSTGNTLIEAFVPKEEDGEED